jgi:hypothetical protein
MDLTGRRRRRGEVIASVLAGSWRADPPATRVRPDDLAMVTPLLVATGAAGLAWRTTKLRADLVHIAEPLHRAWLLEVGRDRLRDEMVAALTAAAVAKGVEVMIYKGWAAARFYPEPGLRPSGDIDVIVEPDDARAAEEIAATVPGIALDIHRSPPPGVGTSRDLLARADQITVDGAAIAVPGPADHVLMSAWHMFKHGAWRPLWLCDIAVMLESSPDETLAADEPYASWWSVAAGLAATMLEARIEHVTAPEWVRLTLAAEWGSGRFRAYGPLAASMRASPLKAMTELPGRLPNRVATAVAQGLRIGAEPNRATRYRVIARRFASCTDRRC